VLGDGFEGEWVGFGELRSVIECAVRDHRFRTGVKSSANIDVGGVVT
jgi:hypothetical protein